MSDDSQELGKRLSERQSENLKGWIMLRFRSQFGTRLNATKDATSECGESEMH